MTDALVPASSETTTLVPAKFDARTELSQLSIAAGVAVVAGFVAALVQPSPAAFLVTESHGVLATWTLAAEKSIFGVHAAAAISVINAVWHAIAALFVAMIAAHLVAAAGRRDANCNAAFATWAGLVYAVFPLTLMMGNGGLRQTAFMTDALMLSSILSYLRFRLLREPGYIPLALGLFAASLLCSPSAAAVAIVIALAELVLFPSDNLPVARRVVFAASFWMVLLMVLSAAALFASGAGAGAVGGVSGIAGTLRVLQGLAASGSAAGAVVSGGFGLACGVGLLRMATGTLDWRAVVWLLGWAFSTSWSGLGAPAAVLASLMLMPVGAPVDRKLACVLATAGAVVLSILVVGLVWTLVSR